MSSGRGGGSRGTPGVGASGLWQRGGYYAACLFWSGSTGSKKLIWLLPNPYRPDAALGGTLGLLVA